eukprot:3498679-Rhodomonas_salina.1
MRQRDIREGEQTRARSRYNMREWQADIRACGTRDAAGPTAPPHPLPTVCPLSAYAQSSVGPTRGLRVVSYRRVPSRARQ